MKTRPLSYGFTVVELLVVISIIGILAGIIYINFNDAREDAKNRAFQAELKELKLSLELYKAQYEKYPDAPPATGGGCASNAGAGVVMADTDNCGSGYIEGLVPDFMAELPSPDKSANENCNIEYYIDSDNLWYKVVAANCHKADSYAEGGVQLGDELAICPDSCSPTSGTCNDYLNAPEDFFEYYAIGSVGGVCEP